MRLGRESGKGSEVDGLLDEAETRREEEDDMGEGR